MVLFFKSKFNSGQKVMLSKISRNLRRNPKFSSFSFSEASQSSKNSNENEETGRKTQADAENENYGILILFPFLL